MTRYERVGRRAGRAWVGSLITLSLAAACGPAVADEVIFNVGAGSQPGSDQRNKTWGADYSFHRWERSDRQHIQVGVSYTSLTTNGPGHDSLVAISVYPQITLYPSKTSKIMARSPAWAQPFFFVRALGPSYISENSLGTREQAEHFAFQAQVGVGVVINEKGIVTFSWKHFSNAELFQPNDGIDVPFVISGGVRF
ncbi:MAG TPA: acyloxyacyl hydrolase [Gammaproteobacteria bacterium]